MNKNEYQSVVESIPVPAGLEERVLLEARRREERAAGHAGAGRWVRPAARAAVCAVCALALVLGSVRLRTPAAPADPVSPGENPEAPGQEETPGVLPLSLSFGLVAYAAGTENTYGPAADGSIAFAAGEGSASPGEGDFTGCLFQITGEDVAQVKMSIDRGGLYRYRIVDHLTDEQLEQYRQNMVEGCLNTAISRTEDGVWYVSEVSVLENGAREDHDPEVRYGFWVPPEEMVQLGEDADLRAEAWANIDIFDGAALTVTAVFENGQERTQVYRLHTGNLKVDWTQDYVLTVLPELAEGEDPFIHGIYAVPEQ